MQISQNEPIWSLIPNAAYESNQVVDVSVVVSLYNYAPYIEECLLSVFDAIRFDPTLSVEVVVVDDASTDLGAAIVQSTSAANPDIPVLLVARYENAGLSHARNLGIRLSRGIAAFILDADNLIKQPCIARLYRSLCETGAVAVYPCIEKFASQDKAIIGTVSSGPFDITRLIEANYIDAMAMFSVSTLFGLGLYDVGMVHGWEDYDLWLSIGFAGLRVESVGEVLASYRVHSDSMLNRLTEHATEVGRYLYLKHKDSLPQLSADQILFGSRLPDLVGFQADDLSTVLGPPVVVEQAVDPGICS